MTFDDFRRVACPPELMEKERSRGKVWKILRIAGTYAAYLFYNLGITANGVDIIRIVLSLMAFLFIAQLLYGNICAAFTGVVLLYLEVFLDFADGAVARAMPKKSDFGKDLDGLPNTLARSVFLVMPGVINGDGLSVILGAAAGYVLITLRLDTFDRVRNSGFPEWAESIFRTALSVVTMLIVLPPFMVLYALAGFRLEALLYFILYFYLSLASLWVLFCAFKKKK